MKYRVQKQAHVHICTRVALKINRGKMFFSVSSGEKLEINLGKKMKFIPNLTLYEYQLQTD